MSFKTLIKQLMLWANMYRVQQLTRHSRMSNLIDTLTLMHPALSTVVLQGLHDTRGLGHMTP